MKSTDFRRTSAPTRPPYTWLKKMKNFYFIWLNVFAEIHNVFHMNLLKLVFIDFLSNQMTNDEQSSEIIVNNEKKYEIKNIIWKKWRQKKHEKQFWLQIKWTNYIQMIWKPKSKLNDTTIMNKWLDHMKNIKNDEKNLLADYHWNFSKKINDMKIWYFIFIWFITICVLYNNQSK